MFNLCKTVKIYQTINHYHITDSAISQIVDSHQLKYEESLFPSKHSQPQDLRIQTIESHSISHRRQGISVSMRDSSESSLSPSKKIMFTKSKKDVLRASRTNSSEIESLKLRTTQRDDCGSPKIIQSKISWADMSPSGKVDSQHISTKQTLPQPQLPLKELLLKKQTTRTTHTSIPQSHRGSQPRVDVEFSPLKRSSSFLRNSINKSRGQDSLRNSLELNLKNSLDLKLSSSRLRKEDASQSLLKLSCSSYSQILGNPPHYNYEDFSQTCSLELKKEESFLRQYANDVSQSIIIGRIIPQKQMKNVRSNNDLLNKDSRILHNDFKPTQSNIIDRDHQSPVRRLKKKYGDNLLNIYDKQTIISKSATSKSMISKSNSEKVAIIDESIIIRHDIQNKFKPLNNKIISLQNYKMFTAIQEEVGLLVSVKQIPIDHIERINSEISVYREIQEHSVQANISRIHQVYTHGDIYAIIKQPYEYTFLEFLEKYCNDFIIVSWEFIIQNIEESLKTTINNLAAKKVYLARFITSQDIVHILGDWKLHSPDMFAVAESQQTAIPVEQAMSFLKDQIFGRIKERKSLQK